MPPKLSTWQQNMLLTGKALGAEVAAPSKNHRAFVSIHGYCVGANPGKRPSIFLNGDHSDVRFSVRVVEVANEHIRAWLNSWDSDYYEREVSKHDEIATIEELEQVLRPYMDDFSRLNSHSNFGVSLPPANNEATWIEQACMELQLDARRFRRVRDDEATRVVRRAEDRFVSQRNKVWWWEHFRCRHYVAWLKEPVFTLLPLLAPTDGEAVWLIMNDVSRIPLVYEGTVEACSAVIGECPAFEYTMVAHDYTWLLCENHHDALFVVGFRAMRRYKQVVRQRPDLLGKVHVGGSH